VAVEVDRHDRLDRRIGAHCGLDAFRVDVQGVRFDVHQHRLRADVFDDVDGRGKCHRRADHSVAWSNTEHCQSDVQRAGARVERQRRLRSDEVAKLGLEAVDPRTGRDPARAQRLHDLLYLLLSDEGW